MLRFKGSSEGESKPVKHFSSSPSLALVPAHWFEKLVIEGVCQSCWRSVCPSGNFSSTPSRRCLVWRRRQTGPCVGLGTKRLPTVRLPVGPPHPWASFSNWRYCSGGPSYENEQWLTRNILVLTLQQENVLSLLLQWKESSFLVLLHRYSGSRNEDWCLASPFPMNLLAEMRWV